MATTTAQRSAAPAPAYIPPKNHNYQAPAPRWNVGTHPTAADEAMAAACGISAVSAAILRSRGHTSVEAIQRFFNPTAELLRDPMQLPDIVPAIERLYRAVSNKELLLIFGDYDVDGITSTALLVRSLRALGANLLHTVPERHEGYGLSVAAVEEAAASGVTLILTADCGITAHEPVRRARELGIDVIITDHHDPGATLPEALAVINPKRADSEYGFRELCGCAVAFKVMQALMREYWPRHEDAFFGKFVELVGLALVADCVPLVDENRMLAHAGLRSLVTSRKLGLQALFRSSNLKLTGEFVSGRNVGFVLAPRLNAAGRIASPRTCLQLLLSTETAECEMLAAQLEAHNRTRQDLTIATTQEAAELVYKDVDLNRDAIIIVARENWAPGVMGLAASRIVERFSRPAIVLCIENGVAKGSGRSIDGFDLHGLLEATRPLLQSGGGHRAACGLSLSTEKLEEFRAQALRHAGERLEMKSLRPVVDIDCQVSGTDITPQLVKELDQLEPCGQGNPEATLMVERAEIVDGRAMGADGLHLKWKLQANGRFHDAIWWRPGNRADGFGIGKTVDVCFSPQFNTWNDRTTVQLVVKDARLSR